MIGGAAFEDKNRMNFDARQLMDMGVAKPELHWEKISANTDAMVAKLEKLITGGAVIKTNITGTE